MKYECVFTISKNNSESNLTTSAQDTIVYDKFQVENHISCCTSPRANELNAACRLIFWEVG